MDRMEGIRVYIPHEKLIWIPATVLSVEENGKKYRVKVEKMKNDDDSQEEQAETSTTHEENGEEEIVVDLRDPGMPESLPLQNEEFKDNNDGIGVEDMCSLSHLHEPAIVYNLRTRFFAQAPYTYTGKIVVAVNPYKWIKDLYSDDLRDLYTQKAREELPPHVYATSAEAFHNMKHQKMPQSILVSGESGAGKTETVKIMMQHLASISLSLLQDKPRHVSNNSSHSSRHRSSRPPHHPSSSNVSQEDVGIIQKVLKSNPLLEAFGNAKTIRNDNSSRFGKFTQLQFDANYCLMGARCRHYLLEKSRVVAQSKGERNYHIFYQLVSAKESHFGFDASSAAQEFRYLQDEALFLDGQTDFERYQVTRDALTTIGLDEKEQNELLGALCGILRLGQLDFVKVESEKEDDASQPSASLDETAFPDKKQAIQKQKKELQLCAKLLGVDSTALSQQLCRRTVKARQEVYCVPLSTTQAINNRDALAKELYARLFAYLVARVNERISFRPDLNAILSGSASIEKNHHIDLLDIFGFECFETNGFEQFCINFANEKLQQRFTQDIFKTVQEEYTKEHIDWKFIQFQDNQDMLDLLENSMGLLALLNEECVRPMGSDVTFANKIVSVHENHPRLEKARFSQCHFILHHYAGSVSYDSEGFVEKNRDSFQVDLLELLRTSSNTLIADVFNELLWSQDESDPLQLRLSARTSAGAVSSSQRRKSATNLSSSGRKGASFMQETVSYKFKAQLSLLMSDISATEVHYVRCIKPNSMKSDRLFELNSVVNQLRCAGVVEAIRITRAAFPNKMTHERFLRRFLIMKESAQPHEDEQPPETVSSACLELATQLLGRDVKTESTAAPTFVLGKTLIYFGKDILEFLEQKRTLFVHDRAILIQKVFKGWLARLHFAIFKNGILKLQALYRTRSSRVHFLTKRHQIIQIQRIWRGFFTRKMFFAYQKNYQIIKIQKMVRGFLIKKKFQVYKKQVILIQKFFKQKKQKQKFKKFVKEKKKQLEMEEQVFLLKQRLEEEKKIRMEIEEEKKELLEQVSAAAVAASNASSATVIKDESGAAASADSSPSIRNRMKSVDETKLLDDSERMLDYLRKEVNKGRELIEALTQENENLKMENKKVKDAYTAAGASFAALNQHNKQQSKANLRLMSTHAALIKSQEEKMKKYQKQITDLKEELQMQRNVYSAELRTRVQQQDLLIEMVQLVESHGVDDEIVRKMRALVSQSKPGPWHGGGPEPALETGFQVGAAGETTTTPTKSKILRTSSSSKSIGVRRTSSGSSLTAGTGRTDTISSAGAPQVASSGSNSTASTGSLSSNQSIPVRSNRSTTLDSMPSSRQPNDYESTSAYASRAQDAFQTSRQTYTASSSFESNHGGGFSTSSRQQQHVYPSSNDLMEEETKQRKSKRIGGMFKKMFKKEE